MAAKLIPDSVRDALSYDPETGLFAWAVRRGTNIKPGDPAGTTEPSGYIRIRYKGSAYSAHRLAWYMYYGIDPGENEVHHIDFDESNNAISNLHPVTQAVNLRHQRKPRGIFWWRKGRHRYVRAKYRGRMLYSGKSILLAHFHRIMAEREDHPIALTYRPCEEPL
ncbi:MAG: HNH endonuclease [Luminiphilus sp.]|nr:HNH endonuclease [Luminiphilus sp.]